MGEVSKPIMGAQLDFDLDMNQWDDIEEEGEFAWSGPDGRPLVEPDLEEPDISPVGFQSDEIDLPPGTVRFKSDGGHGGHNGLKDVIRHCGRDFMRLRVGVGHPGHKDAVTSYVLKKASSDVEAGMLRNIDEAADVMPMLVEDGLEAAMKDLHTGN